MNSNAQVNVDYKFRFAHVLNFFKDLISASSEIEDKELDSKVQAIIKEQDTAYMESLEKNITTYVVKESKTKAKNTNFNNVKNVKNKVQSKTSEETNIELEKDDEKEL